MAAGVVGSTTLRIGTRGSALALAQARLVTEALSAAGRDSRIVVVETEGDRRAPDTAWGEGAFVKAIESALLDGRVDVAVHSAKDIPTDQDGRLTIAAFLPRADPRDALVVRSGEASPTLAGLPPGARIGTDSPRRTCFVLAMRPDLVVHPLHGNVDTRLRRLDAGETDALILAVAGLDRLGRGGRIAERLDPRSVPPAPGQGAIALQARVNDTATRGALEPIDHEQTRIEVEAERAFLAASGGGCRSPIGALAELQGEELTVLGGYGTPDGGSVKIVSAAGRSDDGDRLASELVARLGLRAGDSLRPPSRRVLVTRAADQSAALLAALREAGLDPIAVPTIDVEMGAAGALDEAVGRLAGYDWVVVTSANGARAVLEATVRSGAALAGPRWAAIGTATAAALAEAGIRADLRPASATSADLGAALVATERRAVGDLHVLLVRGDLASGALPAALRDRGAVVDDITGYRTLEAPEASRPLLRAAMAGGPPAAVVFTSGSTVRGLARLGDAVGLDVRSIPSICIGPATSAIAREYGFSVLAVAATAEAGALAAATARALVPASHVVSPEPSLVEQA